MIRALLIVFFSVSFLTQQSFGLGCFSECCHKAEVSPESATSDLPSCHQEAEAEAKDSGPQDSPCNMNDCFTMPTANVVNTASFGYSTEDLEQPLLAYQDSRLVEYKIVYQKPLLENGRGSPYGSKVPIYLSLLKLKLP